MTRYLRISMAVVIVLLTASTSSAQSTPELDVEKPRYRPGATVVIQLRNDTGADLRFESPWRIRDRRSGRVLARYFWNEEERDLATGDERVWRWQQDPNDYSTDATTAVGGHVGAGSYVAEADISDYTLRKVFEIGRYFTLGFDGREDTFVVFVTKQKAIKKMKAEAKAEDKTLIVSGIVRGEVPYNAPWTYSMGSASIVLGEVFTEVCDASPDYVEEHKDAWTGERWCPWSSYVDHMGR